MARSGEKSSKKKYFKDQDYLGVINDEDQEGYIYIIDYKDDYEDYINARFTLKERATIYLSWLDRNLETPSNDLFYDSFSLQMAAKSLAQRAEYTSVISLYNDIVIPSDGLGVFSCLCILSDVKYYSWEPMAIGSRARKLGLITSHESVKSDSLYVFFYCAQYYQLPLFPGHRFLVVDVPTFVKPGFPRGPHVSVSHKDINYYHWYPPEIMAIESAFSLDYVATSIMSTMKIKVKGPLDSQFIIVSNFASLDAAIKSGFFSKEYWENKRERMLKSDRVKYGKISTLLNTIKQKTLLFLERTFPFRRGSSSRWHVEDEWLRRDSGPGFYFFSTSMWYGAPYVNSEVRDDYTFDSGHFIFKDSSKPRHVQYVQLQEYLKDIYSMNIMKVCLVAVYKSNGACFQVYAPESKILRKTILLADN